jgi:hypothetical protein
MFQDLDATLGKLLLRELTPKYRIGEDNISFAAPDEEFRKSGFASPTIGVFLYDIRENHELRSNEWTQERHNGNITRQRPPVRVDCSYLVTTWSSESGGAGVAAEHQLLGDVMRALLRYRRLPAELLQGELTGADPPLRAVAIQQNYLHSLGEFWQAMGGRPRAALHYTVILSIDLFAAEDLGLPVTEKIFRFKQGGGET